MEQSLVALHIQLFVDTPACSLLYHCVHREHEALKGDVVCEPVIRKQHTVPQGFCLVT